MNRVLCFGSLNLDYVYQVDHMVGEGETLTCREMHQMCGGKGLNQSIALARAGMEVFHAGLIGEEGEVLLDCLRENGVDTRFVKSVPQRGGHTIIQVDGQGRNCILLYAGANRSLTASYVEEVLGHFQRGDLLVLQNEVNLLGHMVEVGYERGMEIVLNPSPCDEYLREVDFAKLTTLVLNEVEGEQLTGQEDPERMLDWLGRSYPALEIVLTLGSEGSLYQRAGVVERMGICPVKVVDTTGAGDTFTGYFLASRRMGMEPARALRYASKAASLAVTRRGAAASIPLGSEVFS